MVDVVATRYLGLRQGGQYRRQSWGAGPWFAEVTQNIAEHARGEHSVPLVFEELLGIKRMLPASSGFHRQMMENVRVEDDLHLHRGETKCGSADRGHEGQQLAHPLSPQTMVMPRKTPARATPSSLPVAW